MIILPAIDILSGEVVRLTTGNYGKVKRYAVSPFEAAEEFKAQGARYLHVVDLDGARSGNADNAKTIEKIVSVSGLTVEVGGGIRTFERIQKYIDCGVSRVILGTVAVTDRSFVEKSVYKFGEKIAVGVDASAGKVAVNGWTEITDIDSVGFCRELAKIGVSNVIYTDISKDGMLSGTNLEIYKVLCQTEHIKITASGGIKDVNEIKILKEMGVYATILGKSLYEKAIDLRQAIAVAES